MTKFYSKLLKLIQKRVANISIGASTLRNQGGSGIVSIARNYLAELNLKEFENISETDFKRLLEKHTKRLKKKFPNGAKNNWGAARKAINIFLEDAFYYRQLVEKYGLDKLEMFLEVPSDNDVAKGLTDDAKKNMLPKWKGIRNLKPKESEVYQKYAKTLAGKKRYPGRIYLDLEFWRSNSKKIKQ